MMERHSVDAAQLPWPFAHDFSEKLARPTPVVRVRTRSNQAQVIAKSWKPRRVAPELDGILLSGEFASASPRFVPNSPILHAKRFRIASRGARLSQRCASRRRIAVFHPLLKSFCRKAPYVCREIRFCANQLA